MYLDCWYTKSKPIDIPLNTRRVRVRLQTHSGDVIVKPCSKSCDIYTGFVDMTPPETKKYTKGDKVIFHKDNIVSLRLEDISL